MTIIRENSLRAQKILYHKDESSRTLITLGND